MGARASHALTAAVAILLFLVMGILLRVEMSSRRDGPLIMGDIKAKPVVVEIADQGNFLKPPSNGAVTPTTDPDTITIPPPERSHAMLEEATARFSRYQPTRGVAALSTLYGGLVLAASVDAAAGRVVAYPLTRPEACPDLTLWFRLAGPEILSGLLEQKVRREGLYDNAAPNYV